MKVVITGGLGFIGRAVAAELLRHGHEALLLDSLTPQIHGDIPTSAVPPGAQVVRVDVRELAQRDDLLDGADAVCHFAAETGTAQSMYRMVHYTSVNEVGTAALLEGIARCRRRPRRLILASSRAVYGEGAYLEPARPGALVQPGPRSAQQLADARWDHCSDAGVPLVPVATPESLPPHPGSVYAASKIAQEMLIRASAEALGLRATLLRFQNVYGEGQSLRNPYTGIISIFFNRARQGRPIPIYEDGRESRDFVHVDDVVAAVGRALECDLPRNAVLNVGSGVPVAVHELAQRLNRAAGFDVPIEVTGQYRLGDIRHCHADMALARGLLGWAPAIDLDEGLRRFCAWAGTQPVYADQLDAATRELQRQGLSNPGENRPA